MAVTSPPSHPSPSSDERRLPLPASILGHRIFYGWYIVAVAFFAAMMSSGVSAYSLGIFVTPMEAELGWTRTDLSWGQTASTASMGVMGLFVGGWLDRRGGRGLMVMGAVFAGAGYILLGQVHELWQYYAVKAGVITLGMAGMGAMVTNVAPASCSALSHSFDVNQLISPPSATIVSWSTSVKRVAILQSRYHGPLVPSF